MPETLDQLQARLMAERPELFRTNSKYVAKLSFADRCAFYGLWKLDFTIEALCEAFGIARPTGRYIVRDSSPHYRDVRKEWVDLGRDEFGKRYVLSPIGQEWMAKAMEAKQSASRTNREDASVRAKSSTANKKAKQRQGEVTLVFGPVMGDCSLTFDVQWFDQPPYDEQFQEEREPGWYLELRKGVEGWKPGIYGANDSRFTSTTALQDFIKATEATPL